MNDKQINPKIKCEKCKSSYPNIILAGKEERKDCILQRYYCKKCKTVFALNLPEIKIIKPTFYEIEIGFEVKIKAQIKDNSELGIKSVKCLIMGMSCTKEITLESKDGYLEGMWNTSKLAEGKYKIEITAEDTSGGVRKNTKTVRIVQYYDELIRRIAPKYGFEPSLIKAIIFRESSFNPKAISKKGAKGLMQLGSDVIKMYSITNPFDPEQNINGGCKYLRYLINKFKELDIALASYNYGESIVSKRLKGNLPLSKGMKKYINRIREVEKVFTNDHQKYN